MKIDSFRAIEAKPGSHIKPTGVLTIKVTNTDYQSHGNPETRTKSARFVLRPEAVELLELEVGDRIMMWECFEKGTKFFCISYVPMDFPLKSYSVVAAPPHQMKFACCGLHGQIPDGEYSLGEPFEKVVKIDGQENVLIWSKLTIIEKQK